MILSFRSRSGLYGLMLTGLFLLAAARAHAQQPPAPPRPISVYVNPAQGMNFGAFFHGAAGGSVIIYPNGSRSVTGDVIQANLGFTFSPALFEIDANPGTLISILNGPDAILTGSNGGTLTLHLGGANPGSPFVTSAIPPARTLVSIGGTLYVSNSLANPAGAYSGSFSVTFIQE